MLAVGAVGDCLDIFLSHILSLLVFHLSGKQHDID